MQARHGVWRRAALGVILLGLAAPQIGWAAPSEAPPAAYLHARRALAAPADPAALLPAAQQDPAPFLGHVFEVTGTVSGLMSADGQQTLILTTDPAEGGVTLAPRVPAAVAGADWADAGSRLRALVRVERAGNGQSLSSLTLVAAAPEADVALAEQQARQARADAAARRGAWAVRRRAVLASRSLAYRRQPTAGQASYAASAGGGPVAALSAAARNVYAPYRAAIARLNPRLSDGALDTITTSVLYFSERERVDPRLTIAMIIAESGFDMTSTSRTGAMGLGQLMPGTARGLGVVNAYDPVQNIGAAVHLLRGHLDQYGGRLSLTMAAYNAGPGAVRKYHGVPPYRETQHYVAKVAALYRQLCGG